MIENIDHPLCRDELKERAWDNPNYLAETKLDGTRKICYFDEGKVRLLSRSTQIDRARNFPHICKYIPSLEGTVLDGELVAGNDFGDTVAVTNSSPAEAARKQEELGLAKFFVFDAPFAFGEDIRRLPLKKRREALQEVLRQLNSPYVEIMGWVSSGKREFYENYVQAGGEGIIMKDLRLRYGNGWAKCKARSDVSTVITECTHDQGRAAVELAVYEGDKLVNVGSCAATRFDIQKMAFGDPTSLVGKVLDVHLFEVSKSRRLRNPVWNRLRPDVEPSTCTMDKLLRDVKGSRK